jgi:hypothetical protein
MTKPPDSFTLVLTGQLPIILIVAALLAFPISLLLLRLYRRAVLKSMDRQAGAEADQPIPGLPSGPEVQTPPAPLKIITLPGDDAQFATPEAQARYNRAVRTPWLAAAVYSLGGVSFAGIMAAVYLLSHQVPFLTLRFLMLAWPFGWPLLLTLMLVAGSTARIKTMLAVAYFGGYILLSVVSLALNPQVSVKELVNLWWALNLIPTALVLAFLTRPVRAVGPLVLTFLVIAVTGAVAVVDLAGSSETLLRSAVSVGLALGLGGHGVFIGLHVLGFAAFSALGWVLVQWIRAGFERKKISDQSVTMDSLWLLFAIVYSIFLAFQGAVWLIFGLAAFLAYKIAVAVGFAVVQTPGKSPGIRFLLLRVFALGKRSEKLFDAFGAHWRYLGPIQMIAGPDLATTTVAPHEFLEFLTGKLSRRFIGNRETLERRLSEMDLQPDRDWRYRVNDFFCFADTWKMVLDRLVLESDAVLMDLRSFSQERSGCIFEISELINSVSLDRAVFLIDATTDEPFLRQTIQQAWHNLRPESPNYADPHPQLRFFSYAGPQSQDQLLHAVCAAVAP